MHQLDNPAWHALTNHHREFAIETGGGMRYDPEVSVFGAPADLEDWDAIQALADETGFVVVFGADVAAAPASVAPHPTICVQMVFDAPAPDGAAALNNVVVPLGPADLTEMLELVALAQPGPFLPRTPELGRYVGIRDDGGRLLAMAGERLVLPDYTEVSAVCTHPDARGRGYGAAVTRAVVGMVMERGATAVLHHVVDNEPAHRLYERIGFRTRREMPVTAVTARK